MQRGWRLSVLHKSWTDVFPAVDFGFFFGGCFVLATGSFLCSSSSLLFSVFFRMLVRSDLCDCKGCNSDFMGVVHHCRIWFIGYCCTSAAQRPWLREEGVHICVYSVSPTLFQNSWKFKFHLCVRTQGLYDHSAGLSVGTFLMTGLSLPANFNQNPKTHLSSCNVCGMFWPRSQTPVLVPAGRRQEAPEAPPGSSEPPSSACSTCACCSPCRTRGLGGCSRELRLLREGSTVIV